MQREDVFLKANENAVGGVAADAAVGNLQPGKPGAEIFAPPLGDGVAEQYHGVAILLDARRPLGATINPELAKPVLAAYRPDTGQAIVGRWDLKLRLGLGCDGLFLCVRWRGAAQQE